MARETHRDTSTVNESLQHGKLRIVVRSSPLIERFCLPCLVSAGSALPCLCMLNTAEEALVP